MIIDQVWCTFARLKYIEIELVAPTEGEQPKSVTQLFQNMGIQLARPRSTVQNVETGLQAEKAANAKL